MAEQNDKCGLYDVFVVNYADISFKWITCKT